MMFRRLHLRLKRDYPCAQLVEAVTEYLEDTMGTGERARFDHHLSICPGCADYMAQFRRTIDLCGRITTDDVEALPRPAREELLRAFRDLRAEESSDPRA